jgi:hypothetical protein
MASKKYLTPQEYYGDDDIETWDPVDLTEGDERQTVYPGHLSFGDAIDALMDHPLFHVQDVEHGQLDGKPVSIVTWWEYFPPTR